MKQVEYERKSLIYALKKVTGSKFRNVVRVECESPHTFGRHNFIRSKSPDSLLHFIRGETADVFRVTVVEK